MGWKQRMAAAAGNSTAAAVAAVTAPWRARRLRRAAAANRDSVHLLIPYEKLADTRDRLADISAAQEQDAARLTRRPDPPRPSGGPVRQSPRHLRRR